MKDRLLAVLAGLAAVAAVAVSAAGGAVTADPGITATTIKIGGTFPLTGPASLYKTIPATIAIPARTARSLPFIPIRPSIA
jgi:hypothetical protein